MARRSPARLLAQRQSTPIPSRLDTLCAQVRALESNVTRLTTRLVVLEALLAVLLEDPTVFLKTSHGKMRSPSKRRR